ncbi:MAG TPA: energy transducer TonB [Terracidiphilus sp.]|nr:energy transducer TonB [Terracidiphilus sp.]
MRKCGLLWVLLFLTAMSVYAQPPGERDADGVYSVGSGVTSPKIIQAVPAEIPIDDRLHATRHVCVIETVIAADGTPGAFRVISALSPLDDSAIDAVRKSKFQPGTHLEGMVPVRIEVYVPFGGKSTAPALWDDLVAEKRATYPVPTNHVQAEFSKEARRKRKTGTVWIRLTVTENGEPADVRVVAPAGYGLDEKALEAVRKYRFKPFMVDGIPSSDPITISVNFHFI